MAAINPAQSFFFDPSLGEISNQRFDLEEAKRLLAEAGYPDGEGIPPLKLLHTPDQRREVQVIANILKTNLGVEDRAGHQGLSRPDRRVRQDELRPVPARLGRRLRSGRRARRLDADHLQVQWPPSGQGQDAVRLLLRYPRSTSWSSSSASRPIPEQRKALVQEANRITSDKVASAFLFHQMDILVHPKAVDFPAREPDPGPGRPRSDHGQRLPSAGRAAARPLRPSGPSAAMSRYLIRRTLGAIVVMWAVATLVFFMLRAVPGDPIAAMLFDVADPGRGRGAAPEVRPRPAGLGAIRQVVRARAPGRLRHLALGQRRRGLAGRSSRRCPGRCRSPALSFLIATAIAVPAGLISALKRHSAFDHAVTFVAFLGLAMPEFWLAILLIIVFAANLQWLPAIGYVPLAEGFWPWFSHLILPSIAIGTPFAAIIARMIRSSMLEVLRTEYMRSRAPRACCRPRLIFVHALPNALIPVVTVMGIVLALLMAGTVVVENVFAIKGLGRVLVQGIFNRDYPVVQGAILVVSAIFVFANLVVDVLYTVIDPRIRYD